MDHYKLLADLFAHPDQGYQDRVCEIRNLLASKYPEAALQLDQFLGLLPTDVRFMQELFTRSFEVQAVTTLDIGYVLFGDDYKRGQILAHLAREHREADNDCGYELADHLPNVLRLVAKLENEELLEELLQEILVPAVRKMIAEFEPSRVSQKNELYEKHYKTLLDLPDSTQQGSNLLYQFALRALYSIFKQDFTFSEPIVSASTNDFLHSVMRENEIEASANEPHYYKT